ncbi:MAG: CBS domain-containing protein [Bacteroidota bacterium]
MQVREIMTTPAQVVDPGCSVKDLAEKMRSADLGAIPICDGDKMLGMVTDRDIVTRAVTLDRPLSQCKASDVMSKDVATVREEDDIGKAEQLMSSKQVRRLPVVSGDNRLVGMVTVADLARKANCNIDWALEGITQPSGAQQSRKM